MMSSNWLPILLRHSMEVLMSFKGDAHHQSNIKDGQVLY